MDSAGSIDVGPRTIFFIRMIGSAAADALFFMLMAIGARQFLRTNATPFAPGVIHALILKQWPELGDTANKNRRIDL